MSKKKPCELKGTAGAIAAIPYREPQQVDNHRLEGSWDLHTHSTFSDGEYTVEELIEQARACGLARLAITDHDSVSQLSFIRDRARTLGFPVLAGCEVSAVNPKTGKKVHILAYGLEATPDGSGPLERIVTQRSTCARRTACGRHGASSRQTLSFWASISPSMRSVRLPPKVRASTRRISCRR